MVLVNERFDEMRRSNTKPRRKYAPPITVIRTDDGATLLSPGAVSKRFSVSIPSIWRWTTKGFLIRGQRVKLARLQLGRRLMFREADVVKFMSDVASVAA